MTSYYGGVGARDTPPSIMGLMTNLARVYRAHGLILRSGGAEGADQAFSEGAGGEAVIYTPWHGFKTAALGDKVVCGDHVWLRDIAQRLHPAWEKCTRGGRGLLTRNGAIALGADQNEIVKSQFVIGWTEGGKVEGGTGQMIRVCKDYNIPFVNLGDPAQELTALEFCRRHQELSAREGLVPLETPA